MDLIEKIIQTHKEVAERVGADYDTESECMDRDYLSELTPDELLQELELARLGTQFD